MHIRQVIQRVFAAVDFKGDGASHAARYYDDMAASGQLLPMVPLSEAPDLRPGRIAFTTLCLSLEKQDTMDGEMGRIAQKYPDVKMRSPGLVSCFEMTSAQAAILCHADKKSLLMIFRDGQGHYACETTVNDMARMIESRIAQNLKELKMFYRYPDMQCNGKTQRVAMDESDALQKTAQLFTKITGCRVKNALVDFQLDLQEKSFTGFDPWATGLNVAEDFSTASIVDETAARHADIGADATRTLASKRRINLAFHLKNVN